MEQGEVSLDLIGDLWDELTRPSEHSADRLHDSLVVAANLPRDWQDRLLRFSGSIHSHLASGALPHISAAEIPLIERLFGWNSEWCRDGAELLSRKLAWLYRDGKAAVQDEVMAFREALERMLLTTPEVPYWSPWPYHSFCIESIERMMPALSMPLLREVRSHARYREKGIIYRAIAHARDLDGATVLEIASWADSTTDAALSNNPLTPAAVLWEIARRYEEEPELLRQIAQPTREFVEHYLSRNDTNALRGVARRLDQVDPGHRDTIASLALAEILKNPDDSDWRAADQIYRHMGAQAGVALIRTDNDEIAGAVARAWRWTVDDGVYEALCGYRREIVRRQMLPTGHDDDPYDWTEEEAQRLALILPRLAKDRGSEVRARADAIGERLRGRVQTAALK